MERIKLAFLLHQPRPCCSTFLPTSKDSSSQPNETRPSDLTLVPPLSVSIWSFTKTRADARVCSGSF